MSMAYTGKMLISFSFASGTCIHSWCFSSDCGVIMMQSHFFRIFSLLVLECLTCIVCEDIVDMRKMYIRTLSCRYKKQYYMDSFCLLCTIYRVVLTAL